MILVSHDRDFLDRVAASVIAGEEDGAWIEYAGGYSDMVAQRGHGVRARPQGQDGSTAETAPKAAKDGKSAAQSASSAKPQQSKRKFPFKDKHALETLPSEMEELQIAIATRHGKISDPDGFAKVTAELEKLEADLEATEER